MTPTPRRHRQRRQGRGTGRQDPSDFPVRSALIETCTYTSGLTPPSADRVNIDNVPYAVPQAASIVLGLHHAILPAC